MKAFFLGRSLRERVLLLAFAVIAFGWWAPVALGRLVALQRDWKRTQEDRETQRDWFARKDQIEVRAAAAARMLDPAKTLNASQAFAELNRLASGLNVAITTQRTDRAEQFALNYVQVTISRADLASLLQFYGQLGERAPYLGIEQCVVSVDPANPGMLGAVFRVYSIEALRPAP